MEPSDSRNSIAFAALGIAAIRHGTRPDRLAVECVEHDIYRFRCTECNAIVDVTGKEAAVGAVALGLVRIERVEVQGEDPDRFVSSLVAAHGAT